MSDLLQPADDLPPEDVADYMPLDSAALGAAPASGAVDESDEDFETEPVEPEVEELRDTVPSPLPEEPDTLRLPRLREKAKLLPQTPGVYLMKDARGVVIYVGKSRSLRDRVGSYFVPSADLGGGLGKQRLLMFVCEFDFLPCDTEVEALLTENRLIKDIHPRFNSMMKDDRSYPYLEITSRDDYPGVYVTRQPQSTGTRLYGPFTNASGLHQAVAYLQKAFKFRTCHLEILESDPRKRFFRPCLLYAINLCTGPCGDKVSRGDYRTDIERLKRFLDSKGGDVVREMVAEMETASKNLEFEKAAALRDQIKALRSLSDRGGGGRGRGAVDKSIQTEVFYQDHAGAGALKTLGELLELPETPRSIEGIDIAHFQGEATVGSLVCFIDGRPFKNGYRRYRIKSLADGSVDDYKSIQEVVTRRYRDAGTNQELYPDIILIDGGLGQLHAARDAFAQMDVRPPMVISLAKREEEIYVQSRSAPLKLSRTNPALKLLQHIRDEAHRFGQNYHHLLISKKRFDADVATGKRPPTKRRKRQSHPD